MTSSRARWQVLCAGLCSLILCLGIARFAYTPLLPVMRAQANLSVVGAGWLATINYSGYLLGALLCSLVTDLNLKDRLYRLGMVVAVLSTAVMALASDFNLWAASRFIAGLSSAAGMLLGSGLTFGWLMRNGHRPELGVHFGGVGIGIVVCALAAEAMRGWLDWREQWLVLAVLGLVLLLPTLGWLPRPPRGRVYATGTGPVDRPLSRPFFSLLLLMYFFAGVGFVVSATFIVAIVNKLPGLEGRGILMFLWIGLAAAPCCVFWERVARRIGDLNALAAASALQVVGILLPVWPGGLLSVIFGSILFGGTFPGIVTRVLTMVGHYYPSRPGAMMSRMTVAYGIAQILAPAGTAWIAARSGTYATGLYIGAGSMLACTATLVVLKQLNAHADRGRIPAAPNQLQNDPEATLIRVAQTHRQSID